MLTVALTGNVASGKSTVARVWAENGIAVVSADELAREAVAKGGPGLQEVVAAFGPEVLDREGSLDRAAVRTHIFSDAGARDRLERILHPRIRALLDDWMARQRASGSRLAAAEVPLLFEVGMEGDFDVTVVVHASEDVRIRRLAEKRGLDAEEALAVISAQDPAEEKRRRADYVIVNDGTLQELRAEALSVLGCLQRRAGTEQVVEPEEEADGDEVKG